MSVCHATPPGGVPGDVPEHATALLTPPVTTHPGWVQAVAAGGGMPLGPTPQGLDRERERTTRRGRPIDEKEGR